MNLNPFLLSILKKENHLVNTFDTRYYLKLKIAFKRNGPCHLVSFKKDTRLFELRADQNIEQFSFWCTVWILKRLISKLNPCVSSNDHVTIMRNLIIQRLTTIRDTDSIVPSLVISKNISKKKKSDTFIVTIPTKVIAVDVYCTGILVSRRIGF